MGSRRGWNSTESYNRPGTSVGRNSYNKASNQAVKASSEGHYRRKGRNAQVEEETQCENDSMWGNLPPTVIAQCSSTKQNSLRKFSPTLEGFFKILNRVYYKISICRRVRHIPFSWFQYFCTQFLYAKVLKVKAINDIELKSEDILQASVEQSGIICEYELPTPVLAYINGIGNFTHPLGTYYRADFPFTPNADGHFGKIDSTTHWKYMSFPAPAVVYQRMIADIKYTRGEGGQIWEIPEIRPDSDQCGHPTPNLLGWGPAVQLNDNQLKFLENIGVVDFLNTNPNKYFCSSSLMSYFPRNLLFERKTEFSIGGSVAQYPFISRNDIHSSFECPRAVVWGAGIGHYRVKKDVSSKNWAVYSWNDYTCVPKDWQNTVNDLFNYGDVGLLNCSIYEYRNPFWLYWMYDDVDLYYSSSSSD